VLVLLVHLSRWRVATRIKTTRVWLRILCSFAFPWCCIVDLCGCHPAD
jgi:hypothetical protein